MTYYLFDSKGFVGDLASIHGLFEMREFLCETDSAFSEFFDLGYTLDIARLWVMLSVTESDDEIIDDTIVNLRDLLKKCKDIAIISNGFETDEDAEQMKEIKKRYALPKGKRSDPVIQKQRGREVYKPRGRRVQDFIHAKLADMAREMGAEMTRGTQLFDLVIGEDVIAVFILPPEGLDECDYRNKNNNNSLCFHKPSLISPPVNIPIITIR